MPYHHGNLRAATLRAVETSIREVGVGQLSLRQVARTVGVSNRAPAHHFKDKAGLLTEFAIEGYELLAQSVIESIAAAGASSGPETLAAVGRGYVRFAVGHREHFEVMFRLDVLHPDDERFVAVSDLAYGLLTSTIEQCRREDRLGGRDPELVAVSAWSLVHGLSALWLSGRLSERIVESNIDRLAARVSQLFVDCVLTAASS
ncbi:MAG TPA: TetR-like C-terminal domain-containing protein [Candidatus Acidoferrum sp.]|nr:TetR-like C-terminal domain-containing protein [Candidatus Acidoferrum sp.]